MININVLLIKIIIIYIKEDIENSGKRSFRLDSVYLAFLDTSIEISLSASKRRTCILILKVQKFQDCFLNWIEGLIWYQLNIHFRESFSFRYNIKGYDKPVMDLSGGNYMARGLKPPGLKQKFYLPASFFAKSLDKITESLHWMQHENNSQCLFTHCTTLLKISWNGDFAFKAYIR